MMLPLKTIAHKIKRQQATLWVLCIQSHISCFAFIYDTRFSRGSEHRWQQEFSPAIPIRTQSNRILQMKWSRQEFCAHLQGAERQAEVAR